MPQTSFQKCFRYHQFYCQSFEIIYPFALVVYEIFFLAHIESFTQNPPNVLIL